MAIEYIKRYTDDFDNTPIDADDVRTLEFTFQGVSYQMHVSEDNFAKFAAAIQPFIEKASVTNYSGEVRRERNQRIREYLRSQNIEVSKTGRIPKHLIEKYEQDHKVDQGDTAKTEAQPAEGHAEAPEDNHADNQG